MIYGIYRATALQPNITGQISRLLKYGVLEESIFHIDRSLSDVRLLMQLPDVVEGDVLVMDSLDCIGDTCEQIRDNWKHLSDQKIDLVVLSNPRIDTRIPEKAELNVLFGQLMDVFLELKRRIEKSGRLRESRMRRSAEFTSAGRCRNYRLVTMKSNAAGKMARSVAGRPPKSWAFPKRRFSDGQVR